MFNPKPINDEIMRVNGDREEIGNWSKGTGPQIMHPVSAHTKWLAHEKYGQKVKPYEL